MKTRLSEGVPFVVGGCSLARVCPRVAECHRRPSPGRSKGSGALIGIRRPVSYATPFHASVQIRSGGDKNMRQAIGDVFGLLILAIATVEDFLRSLLAGAGLYSTQRDFVLIAIAVFLALAAVRLLGGIVAVLIVIGLGLLVGHVLIPGLHVN